MSQSATPPTSRLSNRPPRINVQNLNSNNGSAMAAMPPSAPPPLSAHTAHTLDPSSVDGQPYWAAYSNPFAAGNFMARGFDEIVDFTKSGMSFGEKFTYGLYSKVSKWSKKWFTHIFLFIVICLYTVGGALLFVAIEGKQTPQNRIDTSVHQLEQSEQLVALHVKFYNAITQLAQDNQLRKYSHKEFDDNLSMTLKNHQSDMESLLEVKETTAKVEIAKDPWTLWNAMFYCGTIYTTIDPMYFFHIFMNVM